MTNVHKYVLKIAYLWGLELYVLKMRPLITFFLCLPCFENIIKNYLMKIVKITLTS